jgi:hypothetical protein
VTAISSNSLVVQLVGGGYFIGDQSPALGRPGGYDLSVKASHPSGDMWRVVFDNLTGNWAAS